MQLVFSIALFWCKLVLVLLALFLLSYHSFSKQNVQVVIVKSDEASGDWNKISRYYSIQNIYLQNEDYIFVMGFISNSENCWHFHTPSLISIYFEYLFLMFYWWISEYLTIFPALAIHTAYSDLSAEVEPVISNSPTDSMAHTKRILVPIDEKEHCMRAFDCKYITAVEYFTAAFGRPLVYCTSFQN